MTLVAIYAVLGVVLKIFFMVNILPPCLFTWLFGVHCPGCGLTTAFLHILRFEFREAIAMNPMIFIVAPAFAFYAVVDFLKFKRELTA